MFDPRDPYERYWWHYDSRRPLSMAQIIAMKSVDAETVALIRAEPRLVGLNLVGPEDYLVARRDYTRQMQIIRFLAGDVPVALHAGELWLGLVPPADRVHDGKQRHVEELSDLEKRVRVRPPHEFLADETDVDGGFGHAIFLRE